MTKVNAPYSQLVHRWTRLPWPPYDWHVDPRYAIYERAYALRWTPQLKRPNPPIMLTWDQWF